MALASYPFDYRDLITYATCEDFIGVVQLITNQRQHYCTAAKLNNGWFVTAKHCFQNNNHCNNAAGVSEIRFLDTEDERDIAFYKYSNSFYLSTNPGYNIRQDDLKV